MTIRRIDQAAAQQQTRKSKALPKENKKEASAEVKDSVSIGSQKEAQVAPKKWTILHYSAADNNLTSYLVSDVNEMEAVGSTENMNIIVQLDKGGSDCKRYYLEQDNNMREITSPVLEEMGSINMSDPRRLAEFIKFGMQKYPAEHYALIISDHGYAWKGAVEDDSHGGWMTTPDIRKGIEMAERDTNKKIDVLGFDACLMATSEVAYEMKDNVNYLVASQQSEGAEGWPYTPLLTRKTLQSLERALKNKLNISPEDFAKKVVDTAEGDQGNLPTMSAIDLSKMKELGDATNLLAAQIMLTDTPNDVLKDIARKTQSFYGFKDQYHFAEQIANSEDISDEKLKKAARGMMKAIENAVVAEQHSSRYPNAHGLTAEIPTWGSVDSEYKDLRYAENTLWDEAMNKMLDK